MTEVGGGAPALVHFLLLQAEFNRMKPMGRNEFQGSNLRTAFRPGMQNGAERGPWAGPGAGF